MLHGMLRKTSRADDLPPVVSAKVGAELGTFSQHVRSCSRAAKSRFRDRNPLRDIPRCLRAEGATGSRAAYFGSTGEVESSSPREFIGTPRRVDHLLSIGEPKSSMGAEPKSLPHLFATCSHMIARS